jgi:hypothetical protein
MQGLRSKIDRDKYYVIHGERLERVQQATLKLYTEQFHGNEIRDIAQNLEFVVLDAEEEQIPENNENQIIAYINNILSTHEHSSSEKASRIQLYLNRITR